jgi:hypothetical protein
VILIFLIIGLFLAIAPRLKLLDLIGSKMTNLSLYHESGVSRCYNYTKERIYEKEQRQ